MAGLDFTGRTILVTGASRGIAAALVRALDAAGAQVIVHFSAEADRAAGLDGAAGRLAAGLARKAPLLDIDLALPGAAAELAQQAQALGLAPDGLVLSASVQVHRAFAAQDDRDLARQIQVNLLANIQILQGLLPGMMARGFGRVLSIGSVQETAPSAEMPIYSMTKAALRNLIEGLALQAAPFGVTLNTLSPGLVQTDRNAFRRADPEVWRQVSARANPMGRAALPDDMVAPALMLLSREAAFVTGAALPVSGGAHIPDRTRKP